MITLRTKQEAMRAAYGFQTDETETVLVENPEFGYVTVFNKVTKKKVFTCKWKNSNIILLN